MNKTKTAHAPTDTAPDEQAPLDHEPGPDLAGFAAVDSGRLLVVDPGYLPADLLARLLEPRDNLDGGSLAVVVPTPSGDGYLPVLHDREGLFVDFADDTDYLD